MGYRSFRQRTARPDTPSARPRVRSIADDSQWSLSEYVCTAGPHDHPFEERHDRVSLALVTSGTFRYRTDTGEGLLYPGAFLLGNAGACYECGHEHSHGDHCLALHVSQDVFAEIVLGSAPSRQSMFRRAVLPAVPSLAPLSAAMRRHPSSSLAREELIFDLIAAIARLAAANYSDPRKIRPAALRRIPQVFDYVDHHLSSSLTLAALSSHLSMSRFHFLRTFKYATGLTPHQYVLGRRLRFVADRLEATDDSIAHIAASAGFGDLSTFNHLFRRAMQCSPSFFRSQRNARALKPGVSAGAETKS